MSKGIKTVLTIAAVLFAMSPGMLHAAETRTPTPEEFRELVKQYRRYGSPVPGQNIRPPKGIDEYNRALALHTKKDATASELKEAAQLYQSAADAGIMQAQTNLALLYLEGKGVKKNQKKAVALLDSAAKKGEPQADLALARLYLSGKDLKLDEKKGEFHLDRAAKTGNQAAVKMLADYREWKKKNALAMKEYQEVMKKAQLSQVVSKPIELNPFSGKTKTEVPLKELLNARKPELPFPGLPGFAYIGLNPLFSNPFSVPVPTGANTPKPLVEIQPLKKE